MERTNKNSEIQSNKEEIKEKPPLSERNPLNKKDELNQTQKKSYFQKHKLLIIPLIILICVIIVSLTTFIIFYSKKKDDTPVIVEIKREINQIDYYYSNKKQAIDIENLNSNENVRNLEDEITKTSQLVSINSLIIINTFDIQKDKDGRDVFKSFIIIKELNATKENENEQKILSLDLNITEGDKYEENQNEENLNEINNIPLIQVEYYKNGTIINEYVHKNLNQSYLEILEYSKEKLIPLVAESLYKNNNLRTLSEGEDKISYEENKKENVIILKREVNKKVSNNGIIMKDSLNKGNMTTTIVNGTIQNIELNASLSLLTNDTNENKDETFVELPYQKISSEYYENFTFVKSDISKQITNNLKKLSEKLSLINKNLIDKENEKVEDNLEEKSNLRRLASDSFFIDDSKEHTIISTSFLGAKIRLYILIQSYLNSGKIKIKLNLQFGSITVTIIGYEKYIQVNYGQNQILNTIIGYKNYVDNYEKNFLRSLINFDKTLKVIYKNINYNIQKLIKNKNKLFEIIDKYEKKTLSAEDLIKNFKKINITQLENEFIVHFELIYLKNLESYINNFKKNITQYFNGKTPKIPNYYSPLYTLKQLNQKITKDVVSLTKDAQKYFNSKRNLRNLEDINDIEDENIDKDLLRGLSQNSSVSGNNFTTGIIQDFDKMSYEYYLFIYNLSLNSDRNSIKQLLPNLYNTIFSGFLSKNYSKPKFLLNTTIQTNNQANITNSIKQIYSAANSLQIKVKSFFTITNFVNQFNQITNALKDIYINIFPNSKLITYNSMLLNWKKILKSLPNKIYLDIDLRRKDLKLFGVNIGYFGYKFKLEGRLKQSLLNVKVFISYSLHDYSISLNVVVQSSSELTIEGSIDALVIGGGAEAYISFGKFEFYFKPSINLLNLNGKIKSGIIYYIPQLGFRAYVTYTVIVLKCKIILIIPICYPWIEKRKTTLFDVHTPSKYYSLNWDRNFYVEIENNSKWKERELADLKILISKENWIIKYFN